MILNHKISKMFRDTGSLPVPLGTSSVRIAGLPRLDGLDRIGRGAEVMLGNVSDTGGLASGVCRETGGTQ
jgi:hypothetical protein